MGKINELKFELIQHARNSLDLALSDILNFKIFFYSKAKAQWIYPINALHCIGLKKKR